MARRMRRNYPKDMQTKLDKMGQELRKDIERIDDPKGQALFETAAEVITGLRTAFENYESESEEVWK